MHSFCIEYALGLCANLLHSEISHTHFLESEPELVKQVAIEFFFFVIHIEKDSSLGNFLQEFSNFAIPRKK